MQLDTERYRHYLDAYEMSHEDNVRLMEQLWDILHSAMTRLDGGSPEQLLQQMRAWESCNPDSDRVQSEHTISSTFTDAALGEAAETSPP